MAFWNRGGRIGGVEGDVCVIGAAGGGSIGAGIAGRFEAVGFGDVADDRSGFIKDVDGFDGRCGG